MSKLYLSRLKSINPFVKKGKIHILEKTDLFLSFKNYKYN